MTLADLMGALARKRRPVADLGTRMGSCREVLHANNAALGYLARIQEALADRTPLPAARVQRLVAGVTTQTFRMIQNLDRITPGRYRDVLTRFMDIKSSLARRIEVPTRRGTVGYVAPLHELDATFADVVGQKSAFLGEARRWLRTHVPAGFGTSSEAYRAFMEADGLGTRVAAVLDRAVCGDVTGCFEASAELVRLVEGARVPPGVAEAIERAVAEIPGGPDRRFAVRSSALMEGGFEMSFAGQYRSFLNVPPGAVVEAFKRVVASKYSPEAMAYRAARGFDDQDVAMCCCVIEMVDAVAAGVLYTDCRTDNETVTLIQAVRGLGLSAVDGLAEPDSFTVGNTTRKLLERRAGHQTWQIVSAPIEGTARVGVPADAAGRLTLTDNQALDLAHLAWSLQSLLGMPLDMEWALDRDGQFVVLQLRPQPVPVTRGAKPTERRIAGSRILLEGGSVASTGVAYGPVHLVESDLDILRCPAGAVVVTSEASPRLAVLLSRVAAVVADRGEVTGHLATVARESRVPALLATRRATAVLRPGVPVTVDAGAAVVYEGRVEEILAAPPVPPEVVDPQRALLTSVAELITPLTLKDRLATGHSPRACVTLHDIIRFCHQATIEAIFDLGDGALHRGEPLRRLVSGVPIDCRLFDLGGGIREGTAPGDVTIADVACRPMQALWCGMTDQRLAWRVLRPVSLTGFASALVNYNFDHDQRMRNLGEPSYAFITGDYLNLNSRIGYHFTTVDARLGEITESNYASLRFAGGSTGIDQRARRGTLLRRLLEARGFETDCRADLVNARIRHRAADEMEAAMVFIGLLLGYVNHLDMALTSDAVMRDYEAAFLAGEYAYKGSGADA